MRSKSGPLPSGDAPDARSRVPGLDAARGAAMLLVCLAHFSDAYFDPLGLGDLSDSFDIVTHTATPTFVLISGIVLGFLFSTVPAKARERLARKLVDRALFLLVVAHALIAFTNVPRLGASAFRIVYVTDAVAVCLVVGTGLVPWLSRPLRVAAGAGSYLAATAAAYLWLPGPGLVQFFKHLLAGNRPDVEASVFAYNFPLLQWLGVYLCATALGEWMGRSPDFAAGRPRGLVTLGGLGALLAVSAVALRYLRPLALRVLGPTPAHSAAVVSLTSSTQKLPPSPVYVLFYAGLGVCVVAGCLWLSRLSFLHTPVELLALVGRNSLVAFVLQYFVYYVVVFLLRLPYTPLWPVIFAAGFGAVIAGAGAWERWCGPRWLTVGYPALVAWTTREVESVAVTLTHSRT